MKSVHMLIPSVNGTVLSVFQGQRNHTQVITWASNEDFPHPVQHVYCGFYTTKAVCGLRNTTSAVMLGVVLLTNQVSAATFTSF